jgi:hypothetical protein
MAGILARHETIARRRANRAARVEVSKSDTFRGKLIDVRRFDPGLAVTAEIAVPQIIGQNEDNVRMAGSGARYLSQRTRTATSNQQQRQPKSAKSTQRIPFRHSLQCGELPFERLHKTLCICRGTRQFGHNMVPEEASSGGGPASSGGRPARRGHRGRRSGRGRGRSGGRPSPRPPAGQTDDSAEPIEGQEEQPGPEMAETGETTDSSLETAPRAEERRAEQPPREPLPGTPAAYTRTFQTPKAQRRPADPASVTDAIEQVNKVIESLRESLDEMEAVLETLELAERQKNADEQEIESLRRSLRNLHRPRDGGHGREPRENREPREQHSSEHH